MSVSRIHSERGLTLIELVVVAVLIAILSGILYQTLNGIIRARDSSDGLRISDQTAHYIFTRLSNELSGRGFIALNQKAEGEDGAAPPSAASAAPSYLLGVNARSGESDQDTLRFVSANAAQPFVNGPANFGLVEVQYHLDEDPNAAPSSLEEKTYTLVREEEPAAVTSSDLVKKRRIILPVAENITSLNFRYLKGGEWKEEWKSSNPPLPEAIEIAIKIKIPNGRTQTYRTAVPISAKQRQPQQSQPQ